MTRKPPAPALLGAIADDITGAADLALMLGRHGLTATLFIGVPDPDSTWPETPGVVVALKTRTAPSEAAVQVSLAAVRWLLRHGARQIYFKYCSTFDSTARGNIGPVALALQEACGARTTLVCPAFPANGRTVYRGHLFVGDRLLADSGMRHHPLTPMTESDLGALLGRQLPDPGAVGRLPYPVVAAGPEAVRAEMARQAAAGRRFLVADALEDDHLRTLGAAAWDLPLVTGASGLALGLPEAFRRAGLLEPMQGLAPLPGVGGPAAVLAGSCSPATQAQVRHMARTHPALAIDPQALADGRQGLAAALAWAREHLPREPVLIYATAPAEAVAAAQAALGRDRAGHLVEDTLAAAAVGLREAGVRRLVVAGGETAGAVLDALGVRQLTIGPEIAPGVPWTIAPGAPPLLLALKSGNFGGEDFFTRALDMAR